MKNDLTIIMYHYIRPIIGKKRQNIKGLDYKNFIKQLDHLEENYKIISVEEILFLINKNKSIPKNSCWLTFDDGLKDHFEYVYPELKKRGLQGSFFPSSDPILKNKILEVHMIQHILAKCKNINLLKKEIVQFCLESSWSNNEIKKSEKKYSIPNRFDDETTSYIKRMLQFVIPKNIRSEIIKLLFKKYVQVSQKNFVMELYMSTNNLKELVDNGMYVGIHGAKHQLLNKISFNEQKKEIQSSLDFLKVISSKKKDWVMCYPFGAYNKETLLIIKKYGAKIGITTEPKIANLSTDNLLTLPRIDTNDLFKKNTSN